jgi:mono/diheme cytochrome c family protein
MTFFFSSFRQRADRAPGARSRGWRLAAALAVAAAAVGCDNTTQPSASPGGVDDEPWWQDDSEGAADGGRRGDLPPGLRENARRILTEHCAPCHSGREGVAEGGFGDIFNVGVMTGAGLVVPGNAKASPLYQRMAEGEMPPPGAVAPSDPSHPLGPVSAEDQALIAEWIEWGAPSLRGALRSYTGAELRQRMADDIATLPAGDLAFYRYVALSSLHGSMGYFDALDTAANAVGTALNMLSPSRQAAGRPAVLLDAAGEPLALRVDLRDYELDAADWARIEGAAEVIDRQAFPCRVPFLQVEQFLALAMNDENVLADGRVESVYSNIVLRRMLERAGVLAPGQLVFAPGDQNAAEPLVGAVTLPQLASALGVDLAGDIARGGDAAVRFCGTSGVTTGEHCSQRDAMPGGEGRGFWWAMRLDPSASGVNAAPIGPANGNLALADAERFTLKEGVALWPWPNASTGFAAFDDQLRLRSSPIEHAFSTPYAAGQGGAVGCASCHMNGPIAGSDQLRPALERGDAPFDAAEADFIRRLVPPQSDVDEQIDHDADLTVEAARARCLRGCIDPLTAELGSHAVASLSRLYGPELTFADAASNLFLDLESFASLLRSDPELSAAIDPNAGRVPRRALTLAFDQLRRAAVAAGGDEAALNFCALPEG